MKIFDIFKRGPREKLGKGEGVSHGYEYHYRKEKGIATKNRFLNLLIRAGTGILDFGEGFITRKTTKDSKAMRWGAGLAKFADNAAKNMEKRSKSDKSLLPKNVLEKEPVKE